MCDYCYLREMYFEAEVAVDNVQAEEQAEEDDGLVAEEQGPWLVELLEDRVSLVDQDLEVVGQLLLHEGQSDPGPRSAEARPASNGSRRSF